MTTLSLAACHDRAEDVARLLAEGAEIDALNAEGRTPLQVALACGATRAALVLIVRGAALDVDDDNHRTPLHAAALGGYLQLVEAMLAQGAFVDDRDTYGCTPLHLAVTGGHIRLVEFLLVHGAAVNAQSLEYEDAWDRGDWTPLHEAARSGRADIVEALLDHGANVHAHDRHLPRHETIELPGGRTPLYYAAAKGDISVIERLLAHGAEIDEPDEQGFTALHAAAVAARVDAVRVLLVHGASVWARNRFGESIYDWAVGDALQPGAVLRWPTDEIILAHGAGDERASPRDKQITEMDQEWRRGSPQSAVRRAARLVERSDDIYRRLEAIRCLGDYGSAVRPAAGPAVSGIADPDALAEALAREAVPVLIAALTDSDDRVRLHACASLGKIGPRAAEAVPHLWRLHQDYSNSPVLQAKVKMVLREIEQGSESSGGA